MRWFLLWSVLVLAAAGVFFLLGRNLWRTSRALVRDLGAAADRLDVLTERLTELDEAREASQNPTPTGTGDVRSPGSGPRQQR